MGLLVHFFLCVRVCVPGTSTVWVLAAEAEDITKMSSSYVQSDQRQGRSLRSASSTPPLRDEHRNDHSQIRVHADYGDTFETDLHHGRQDTHAALPKPQPHTPGTDQSVQLSDLLQLMSQQEEQRRRDEAARQALEERRLRLEELKIQLERERMEKENAREASQAAATALDKATRLKEQDLDRRLKEVPQLPRMSEEEDVEMYLAGFKKRMNSLEIPHDRWVANLHPLLSTWALGTVDTLNVAESRVYSKVKKTLLEAFESTQGSLGQRVLNPKRKPGQKAAHLAAQLQRSWTHWTEGLTVQEICAKCTMIQIEMMLPLPCRSYVQARNSTTVQGLVGDIEKFFSERNSSWDDPRWHQQRVPTHRRFDSHQQQSDHRQPQGQQPNNHQGQQPNTHQGQHSNRQGQRKDNLASPQPGSKDSRSFQTPRPHRFNRDQVRCFVCHKLGHYAQNCPDAVPRISRLSRARQNFAVHVTVNTAQMKAVRLLCQHTWSHHLPTRGTS